MRINNYNNCKILLDLIIIYGFCKNVSIISALSTTVAYFCKFMLNKVDTSLLGCSVPYLEYLNCNEMVLSNTNVIFQIIFCQVTLLKNPEVKPDDLDALLMS